MNEAGSKPGAPELQDGLFVSALSEVIADTLMEMHVGETDEGDLYYLVTMPDGSEYLTFALLGEHRVLYGPVLPAALTWTVGETIPPSLAEFLPSVQDAYERLAA